MYLSGASTALNIGDAMVINAADHGVTPGNSAATNTTNLQAVIDANTVGGGIIWIDKPIPCNPIILKSNVHLRGNNIAAFKGSKPYGGGAASLSALPSGAAFLITSTAGPFVKMQSNTSIDGFVFHYPSQVYTAITIAGTTAYPATITKDTGAIEGISLSRLCFVGATTCMSFPADSTNFIADMAIDLCYGYPIGGYFLRIDWALDIPRITRCHVNPGVGYQYLGDAQGFATVPLKSALVSDITGNNPVATYYFDSCDELGMSQCFVYGHALGYHFKDSYGTILGCNADIVANGFKSEFNGAKPYKYLELAGASTIIGVATGNAFVASGTGGALKLNGCNAFTNTGAGAFVIVNGSGAQFVNLVDCAYSTNGGTWASGVNKVNASATVTGTPVAY